MVRARYLVTGLLLAGAIAIPALASGTARRVVGNCTQSQVRPATIIIACADANLALTHLHWSNFGGATATAAGSYSANDCTPNCAAGHFHAFAVRVVLSRARPCPDKHDDYRSAALTFTAARPPGIKSATTSVSLPGCPLHG
ncbi:MAG TPA: hypothetical protein VFC22_01755 [Solirubrobacteraceae bacterium]|jgi:hypothetical protein|nr:hypothetical protein [Solirubrobacteraceae bacterium]